MKNITSLSNSLIKKILLLQEKSKVRTDENLFVIDGWKETLMAIENGFEIETIVCTESFLPMVNNQQSTEIIIVSNDVFDKISYRGNTSKVVAIAKQKKLELNKVRQDKNPIFLVLDGIEKPGNLGALLRVADATNITAVICCDAKTDIYNPNVIRSSVGCLFTKQIVVATKEDTLEFLNKNKIQIFTTSLKASENYLKCNFTESLAFVLGTEATGVDAFWEENSTQNIIIPMLGQNDSLNVSNTAAIILYETIRQRNK